MAARHFFTIVSILLGITLTLGYPLTTTSVDPELSAGFFEGDIDLSDDQIMEMISRNGLIARSTRWPDRVVIYKISTAFDSAHRDYILSAIKSIEAATCVRFQEADDTSKYYVNISAEPTGCHSAVGFQNNIQRMNLQVHPLDEGCFRMGTIFHEFLHVLGFYHQQSASDRDQYIKVIEENIIPGMEYNFAKQTKTENFGISYDYKSVLHYSAVAFSKNGKKTIVTEDPHADIGQRSKMSDKDLQKLNTMYLCPVQI